MLLSGETQIAEPRIGGLNPFPAVGGLGGCGDVGQSRVQLGQFQAPLSSRVEVPPLTARGGFVKEPFGFAVVIWAVHSLSSVAVRVVQRQGHEGLR